MQTPILHIFNISHYCEKARWALDLCGVDYQNNVMSPISHLGNAKRLGLDTASLPILETENSVIQGSDQIIDWAAENKNSEVSLSYLSPQAQSIEQQLNTVLGVNVRKWYYSEALVEHPKSVLNIFVKGLPFKERIAIRLAWPKVRSVMIKKMDLGAEQGEQARQLVDQQLTMLDEFLDNEKTAASEAPFGKHFSRVELTAASLLAPLVLPSQHPMAGAITLPPKLAKQIESWRNRPSLEWVKETYATFR